ncbi:hypothetical protein [Candidatus Thiodubiliella endoseptemdiera]|uniref:hypothetical protein n=1 Tax=Candidatus Thiodubiliella endoseptemdiera TaxID=2738886 RepID=UPI0034DF65D3
MKARVLNNEEQFFFASMMPTRLSMKKVEELDAFFIALTEAERNELDEYERRVQLFYRMVRVWAGFSGYLSNGYDNYGKPLK